MLFIVDSSIELFWSPITCICYLSVNPSSQSLDKVQFSKMLAMLISLFECCTHIETKFKSIPSICCLRAWIIFIITQWLSHKGLVFLVSTPPHFLFSGIQSQDKEGVLRFFSKSDSQPNLAQSDLSEGNFIIGDYSYF